MKKPLFFSIVCLLIIAPIFSQTRIQVQQGENQLTLTQNRQDGFSVQNTIAYFNIELEKIFQRGAYIEIVANGYGPSFNIGNPDLPALNRLIEVPVGATVEVNVVSYDEVVFNLPDFDINMQIVPSQESVSKSDNPATIEFIKNESIYETDNWFSNPMARYHDEGIMRGVRLGRLEINPFAYNPVTGELKVYNNLKVEIKFIKGDYAKTEQLKKQYYSPAFNGLFAGLLNYTNSVSKNDVSVNSIPMHFVMISHRMFESTLAPFIAWKKKQGFIVTVRYTDEPEVGRTTASIKNYLQGLYTDASPSAPAPAYIALIGDIQQVPSFNGTTGLHVTDLYYTTYDGPNDFIPDVHIGRMSAQTTAQLTSIINKTLLYEKFEMADPSYFAKSLTIAGYDAEYAPTFGNGSLNYMAHYLNAAHGINPTALYHPANTQQPAVLNALNSGVGIGVYTGHCGWNLWDSPRVDVTHINNLTNNGKYGLLIGNCCFSAKFDENECLGEAVIRAVNKGGVGYIGASNITYWQQDYWWITGYGPILVNPQIKNSGIGSFDALFHENGEPAGMRAITGAQMNMAGCLGVNESVNSNIKKYYWEIYHFLGDPTLMPYIGPMPAMKPNHVATMIAGLTSLAVTNLAPGCYVALTDNGKLKAAGFADHTGSITLEFEAFTAPANADLVATTTFYRPYFGNVEIVLTNSPYVVYSSSHPSELTYISQNSAIDVTLKNVGAHPTAGTLTLQFACNDPQLTIHTPTATHGSIVNAGGTATVSINVTVANDIPDGKIFPVVITATDGNATWESTMLLKALAPKFSLEKVFINGIENSKLEKGTVNTMIAIIKNKGGADAFNVTGSLEIGSPYITLACSELNATVQNLPAGAIMTFPFTVITDQNMPYPHEYEVDINLLLNAQYGRSFTAPFTVTCSGPSNYCVPRPVNCLPFKFTSVILYKTSEPSNLLINNTDDTCTPRGYSDFTHISVAFEPGVNYTIEIMINGWGSRYVRGWIDLNGNNIFDNDELLINCTLSSSSAEECLAIFTIPEDVTPGTQRFRLRVTNDRTPNPCTWNYDEHNRGQIHDYSAVFPEYPRIQNVYATLLEDEEKIAITWDAPEEGTPIGYNIYRQGSLLNAGILNVRTFTEENITNGIFVYNVTAVYENNKESFAEMSNVICHFTPPQLCEKPANLYGTDDEVCGAIITWSEPETDDTLLRYNIYRNGKKISETLPSVWEYRDENLVNGTYLYKVSALYAHCGESPLTEGVSVTINCLGINEIPTPSFNIFPNPTTGNVTFEGIGLSRVEIYDIQGRKLNEYNATNKLQINVNHLNNGIYFVRMYSEKGMAVTKRLVIVR